MTARAFDPLPQLAVDHAPSCGGRSVGPDGRCASCRAQVEPAPGVQYHPSSYTRFERGHLATCNRSVPVGNGERGAGCHRQTDVLDLSRVGS